MQDHMINEQSLKIAVDFDGTIVEHRYPRIGEEMLFAFETLRELKKKGHMLILWTFREGEELEAAVEFCRERGLEFWAVNQNFPEETYDSMENRKVLADIYIDDRNVGGFPGWSKVWQMLHPESGPLEHQLVDPQAHHNYPEEKKGMLDRLKRVFGKA